MPDRWKRGGTLNRINRTDWVIIEEALALLEALVEADEPDPTGRRHKGWTIRSERVTTARLKVRARIPGYPVVPPPREPETDPQE